MSHTSLGDAVLADLLHYYGDFLQGLHSLDLLGEAVEHGLTTAQQVGLQYHSHALAEVLATCHFTAHVPEEEVADSFALGGGQGRSNSFLLLGK